MNSARRPPTYRQSTTDSLGDRGRTSRRTCAHVPRCHEKPVNLKSPYEGGLIPSLYCRKRMSNIHTCQLPLDSELITSQDTCHWQYPPFDEVCCQVASEPGKDYCDKRKLPTHWTSYIDLTLINSRLQNLSTTVMCSTRLSKGKVAPRHRRGRGSGCSLVLSESLLC